MQLHNIAHDAHFNQPAKLQTVKVITLQKTHDKTSALKCSHLNVQTALSFATTQAQSLFRHSVTALWTKC